MLPLFTKWMEFERIHGTEEQQNEVRRTALAFLHINCSCFGNTKTATDAEEDTNPPISGGH